MLAARAALAAAHAAYAPNIAITAQSYNGTSAPALGRSGGQVQLAVTLPIADGGDRVAAIGKATSDLAGAVALQEQVTLGVRRDVANAFRELAAARKNLLTAQSIKADAEEQLRIARLRESAGKGIAQDVLDALAGVANARETVARSITRFDDTVAAVHHAAGDRTL